MSNPVARTRPTRGQPLVSLASLVNARRSQDSSSTSQIENSGARCCVVLGKDLKKLPDEILATSELQPEQTPADNSVSFHYSAMSPAARSARQAVRATLHRQVYRRNPAVTGINKEGSHLHYLAMKIERKKSKLTSYTDILNTDIKWVNSKVDTLAIHLREKRRIVSCKIDRVTPNSHLDIERLNEKLRRYVRAIKRNFQLLLYRIHSSVHATKNKINKLKIETAPYANDVDKQMKRLKSQLALYKRHFMEKMRLLRSNITSCGTLKREIRLLENGVIN